MRWVFSLLLLVNVIYFLWQNPLVTKREVVEVIPEGVTGVRLLREIDASLLLPRSSDNSIIAESFVGGAPEIRGLIENDPLGEPFIEAGSSESGAVKSSLVKTGVEDYLIVDAPAGDLAAEHELLDPQNVNALVSASEISGQSSIDLSVTVQWCQVVSGLDSEDAVQQLLERLLRSGLAAEVKVSEVETVLGYELIMDKSVAKDENVALMDSLSRLGFEPHEVQLKGEPVYVLGRFGSRNEAEGAFLWSEESVAPRIYQVVSKDSRFEIWIASDEGVETSNKIKRLASDSSHEIKIEKKTCKGVASAEGRD